MLEIKIAIPVKPYVKRYLEHEFGTKVLITRESATGKYIFRLFRQRGEANNSELRQYTDEVTIRVSEALFIQAGKPMLSKSQIIELNNFLEEQVKSQMRLFVSASITAVKMASGKKLMIKQAIQSFSEEYGYDEFSFPLASMIKDYQRWRNAQYQKANKERKNIGNKTI